MQDLLKLLSFLLRLAREVRFSRLTMAAIVIAGLISGFANTALIALFNAALTGRGLPMPVLISSFVALCLILPCFRLISQVLLIHLTQHGIRELRLRLCGRILAAPLRQLEAIGPHRLLAALTQDVNTIVDALVQVPLIVMHVGIVVSCLIYLGWLSWVVLLEITGFIVLGVVTYLGPMQLAMRHFSKARRLMDTLLKHIRSLTEGTKELKMHEFRRAAFLQDVRAASTGLQRETRAGGIIFAVASSWGQVLFFVVVGLLLFVLPHFQPVATSTLLGFTLVLFNMMTPLEVLLNAAPNLGRASVSASTIGKLGLSLQQIATDAGQAGTAIEPRWQRLELAGVTHDYHREEATENFVLGPIDLTFRPGELVFIAGGNGSGKTTLAKLLVGLYAPETGEIRFAGTPITAENRYLLREHFAAVFSDFFLFERLLGLDRPVLDGDARKYLAELRLEQKVKVEEGVLSTLELSQGQRKRLALLTAYLEDRPIYLFDEWAADQDPIFKDIFYLEILPGLKAKGKTVIVISHDDRYYHLADRLIKLESGKVEYDRSISEFLSGAGEPGATSRRQAVGDPA
jgi:putative ATP-binding cassette transporter